MSCTRCGIETCRGADQYPTQPSKGHVAYVGDMEYVLGANGDLYRGSWAHTPLDTGGYRMGLRWEGPKHQADEQMRRMYGVAAKFNTPVKRGTTGLGESGTMPNENILEVVRSLTHPKTEGKNAPTCAFCGRSGSGVQFNVFTPRFKPFGTACTDCEKSLPPGTQVPTKGVAPAQTPVKKSESIAMQAKRALSEMHSKHFMEGEGLKIDPAIRKRVNADLEAVGFGGKIYFASISGAIRDAATVLARFGFEWDTVTDANLFLGDKGTRTLDIAKTNQQDHFSPTPISNSTLHFSWTRMDSGRFEVISYLS